MTSKGIMKGRTIELEEHLPLPEGQQVHVTVQPVQQEDVPGSPSFVLRAIVDRYAQLELEQRRKGLSLDENDLWIAATTLAIGAKLVSRDNDFRRIDGFPVEDWSR